MNKKLIAIISAVAIIVVIAIIATCVACNNNNNNNEEETTTDPIVDIPGDESDESNDESGDENEGSNTGSNPEDLTYTDADGFVFVINPYSSEIPVRAGNNDWLGAVKVGEKFERLGVSSDERWTKIKYNDEVAYIATRNLTTYDKDNNNFVAVEKEITLTSAVTVRTSPQVPGGAKDADEKAINAVAWLKAGDVIKVIAEDTELGWYKIEYTPATTPTAPAVEGYTYEFFVAIMDQDEEDNEEESSSDETENKENAEAAGK